MIDDTPNIFTTMIKAIAQQDLLVLSTQLSNNSDISLVDLVYFDSSPTELVYSEPENVDTLYRCF